jgi:hypothetical protein
MTFTMENAPYFLVWYRLAKLGATRTRGIFMAGREKTARAFLEEKLGPLAEFSIEPIGWDEARAIMNSAR